MDRRRAKEIVDSPTIIRVTCNGVSVYIENIHDHSDTATIHPVDNPREPEEVSLSNLTES